MQEVVSITTEACRKASILPDIQILRAGHHKMMKHQQEGVLGFCAKQQAIHCSKRTRTLASDSSIK